MSYLAWPYSDPEASVGQLRLDQACERAAALMLTGEFVYCAVVYGHALARSLGLPAWREAVGGARVGAS